MTVYLELLRHGETELGGGLRGSLDDALTATGWAQLRYPYGASVHDAEEKLKFDLFYVKNHGLVFDLMILLQTVEVVLFGRGAR